MKCARQDYLPLKLVRSEEDKSLACKQKSFLGRQTHDLFKYEMSDLCGTRVLNKEGYFRELRSLYDIYTGSDC